jgi:lipopolysaccharide/colanic/teichoic acid biosynthesis glycosyltransferase
MDSIHPIRVPDPPEWQGGIPVAETELVGVEPLARPARTQVAPAVRAAARRAFDLLAAVALLAVLLPVLLVVAILVKLDSPGPVLFRQRRVGKGLRPFTVLKFRTMASGASSEAHSRYIAELAQGRHRGSELELRKLTDDPRVTRLGRVLRRLSIDELPQLLNVIAGSMALVGPRPAIEYELDHYEPAHFARFEVRPGITGLWQVSGRSRVGFKEMLDLDVEYAETESFVSDLKILARTPRAAIHDAA